MATETKISYLGHAGFIIEHAGTRILMDPWFYPAFLESWFPYPDNRGLLMDVVDGAFDYLYVSHAHEDHFDRRLLDRLDKSVTVLTPKYRSKVVERSFRKLGFENLVLLGHRESHQLSDDIVATMFLDTSHKEDSGLLVDFGDFRFLDLNDCNTPMSELPSDIDILAAQYSGAMWYPNCYDYPPHVMAAKVAGVRNDLLDTLKRKIELTGAKSYIPSAGPACFLDPDLEIYNDRDQTIFPIWEDVSEEFLKGCQGLSVIRIGPGDHVLTSREVGAVRTRTVSGGRLQEESLDDYRERRRGEWMAFQDYDDRAVTTEDLTAYFQQLQRLNKRFLGEFSKEIQLIAGSSQFGVRLGRLAEYFEIEGEEPYDPEYTLLMETSVLRAIVDGKTGWEEALLSMRVGLHREPDTFDLTFMSLLRYGNHPAQTMQMLRERNNTETIERDGLRMQRFCPHAGEDLTYASISNGRIECPRHHWIWDSTTGACVDKGTIPLRVEAVEQARSNT